MNTKLSLALNDAQGIVSAAHAYAVGRGWSVTICVCDDGGHPLLLHRLDGATPLSARIAMAKSMTAALSRRETRHFQEIINTGNTAFISAPAEGLIEGGIPIVVEGHVVGAIGVSGVKSSEDSAIANAGIDAWQAAQAST